MERSDDVGYETESHGSSHEEAADSRPDHAETGSRVAAVLNAAEEAAETIRAEARRHADEVLREAKNDAGARVEELTREAERVRAEADDYARDTIYMTSVDTGWASNENPQPIAEAMKDRGFMPPLDLVDAAARVCDPVARGLRDGELLRGVFLKDYAPITW